MGIFYFRSYGSAIFGLSVVFRCGNCDPSETKTGVRFFCPSTLSRCGYTFNISYRWYYQVQVVVYGYSTPQRLCAVVAPCN